MATATIFCDGASKGNPGPGGWGAVVVYPERSRGVDGKAVKEIGGAQAHTTNNAMELTAAIEGLRAVSSKEVTVYTDSAYVVEGITKWVHQWEKNGWKTRKNEEISNFWLWEALMIEAGEKKVEWKRVSGHSGVWGNERADAIAQSFATKRVPKLFVGELSKYHGKPFDIAVDTKKKEAKDEKRARQNIKAYSYVSLVNGILKVHKTWAECEREVKGKSNARFKKAVSAGEEKEIKREFLSAV